MPGRAGPCGCLGVPGRPSGALRTTFARCPRPISCIQARPGRRLECGRTGGGNVKTLSITRSSPPGLPPSKAIEVESVRPVPLWRLSPGGRHHARPRGSLRRCRPMCHPVGRPTESGPGVTVAEADGTSSFVLAGSHRRSSTRAGPAVPKRSRETSEPSPAAGDPHRVVDDPGSACIHGNRRSGRCDEPEPPLGQGSVRTHGRCVEKSSGFGRGEPSLGGSGRHHGRPSRQRSKGDLPRRCPTDRLANLSGNNRSPRSPLPTQPRPVDGMLGRDRDRC